MMVRRRQDCGSQQDTGDQIWRRLDFFKRLQPTASGFGFLKQRPAELTLVTVGFKRGQPLAREGSVNGLTEQSVALCAVHSVIFLTCHHITCLYVRWRRRASSARPRLILDFTVPSGTFSTVAISR